MTDIENLDTFFGRNTSYSKEKQKIYDRLQDDALSPFKGSTMADIFIYAAVFGFTNKRREKIKKAVPQISAVAFKPRQKSLLLTIAIVENGDIDILFNKEDAISIIEEYANGGIDLLEDQLINNTESDSTVMLASEMRRLAKEWEHNKSSHKN